MDHQGSGRPRPGRADTRGQAAWSWLESGEEPEDPPDQAPGGGKAAGRRGSGSGAGRGSDAGRGSGGQEDLGRGTGERRLGSPTGPQRLTGTGGYPAAGTGGYPTAGTGAYPAAGTGAQPAARTGGYPAAGTGAYPAAGTGAYPAAGTGAQPVAGTGVYPGAGTDPFPAAGTGAFPAAVTGAYPAVATGTQPVAGTGGYPVTGTGARPVAGTGARLATGTGPYPVPGDLTSPGVNDPTPPSGFSPGRGSAKADGLVDDATDPDLARADTLASPSAGAPAADAPPGAAGGPGRRRSTKQGKAKTGSGTAGSPKPGRAKTGRATAKDSQGSWITRLGSRASLVAAAAVVVVAGAGFAGYKYLYEARVNAPVSPTLRLPTTAPSSAGLDQALGKWQHIGSRTTDPDPLTLEGLYPPQFVLNGSSYVRTAASVTKNCQAAVYGGDLQAALQSGHCSQVARASYVSGNNQMMGTVGVINLSTSAAASKAGAATGPQEIIVPLAAKKGVTAKLGQGTGVVQAEIKGHYLILMWAEFTNLKSPPNSAARAQLEQFATNLVTGTANINLSTRMLSGKS